MGNEDTPVRIRKSFAEQTTLALLAAFGLLVGIITIVVGIANGNGGYLDGPTVGDLAGKITTITIGTTVASAGFLALLALLILSGVEKITADR